MLATTIRQHPSELLVAAVPPTCLNIARTHAGLAVDLRPLMMGAVARRRDSNLGGRVDFSGERGSSSVREAGVEK